jgi:hypothetical protein
MSDIYLTYSFTEREIKDLCALLRRRAKNPMVKDSLVQFEKTLNDTLMRRISLEEAEHLFHES